MKKILVVAAVIAGVGAFSSVNAADAAAGKAKAAVCAACHGMAGISANPLWPSLAGQKDQYMIKQLKAFKDGTRKDPLMTAQAAMLSDADMENLSAHFSGLK